MRFLLRAALAIIYLLWLPLMLLARLFGSDPLQLKKPTGPSYWIVRKPITDRQSYFSQASSTEGASASRQGAETGSQVGSSSNILAALLRGFARLLAPPAAGTKIKSAVDREQGVPDEIYTLW